jgi:hypothetical protein
MIENKASILPQDFDGVFRFTNWTDEDFTAKWDNVEYTFPAEKTTPMVMNFTPKEIEHIRKKFAKELAVREFYKSRKFKQMNDPKHGQNPATYTEGELVEYVQKCLLPLEVAPLTAKVLPRQDESSFRRDEDGELVTQVLDKKTSLKKGGSQIVDL